MAKKFFENVFGFGNKTAPPAIPDPSTPVLPEAEAKMQEKVDSPDLDAQLKALEAELEAEEKANPNLFKGAELLDKYEISKVTEGLVRNSKSVTEKIADWFRPQDAKNNKAADKAVKGFYNALIDAEQKGIDHVDKKGNTLLHYAAQAGANDVVDKLLKEGADPNIINKNGKTPLDLADSNSEKKTSKTLKEAGAATSSVLNQQNMAEVEALIAEAEKEEFLRQNKEAVREATGSKKSLEAELDAMLAELEPPEKKSATDLHDPFKAELALLEAELEAAEKANPGAFKDPDKKLLDNNDVNSVIAGLNNSKVEKKSFFGKITDKIAGWLNPKKNKSPEELKKGFNEALNGAEKNGVDYKDKEGNTLLHYAVQAGAKDVVEKLLKEGADPNIANKEGKTPLDLADANKDKNVAAMIAQPLVEAGAAKYADLQKEKAALAHARIIMGENRKFDEFMSDNIAGIAPQSELDAELAKMEANMHAAPNINQKPPFSPALMASDHPPSPAPKNLSPSQGGGHKAPSQGTGKGI